MTSVEYQILLRDRFSRPMTNVNRQVDTFNKKMAVSQTRTRGMKRGMGGMMGGLSSLGRMVGPAGIILGIGALGKSIIKLGSDMQQTEVFFSTMLGSMDKANVLIKQVNDFANITPFENNQLFETTKLLLNYGTTADKVIPTLKMLGDVSGGNAERLQRLALAYGQAKALGKLQGQDLKQMIEVGFNPLQEMVRTTGKSMAQLQDEMRKGKISIEDLDAAFMSATSEGGKFHGMMEKQSKTLAGRWSTFMGKLKMIGIQIGKKLVPILGKAVEGITRFMENAKNNAEVVRQALRPIVDTFKEVGSQVKKFLQTIFKTNKETSSIKDRWEKFAKILKYSLTPLRLAGRMLGRVIEFIRMGVKWAQKMFDKFSGLRSIVKALLYPLKKLRDAFDWINKKLNEGGRAQTKHLSKRMGEYYSLYKQEEISRKRYLEIMERAAINYQKNTGTAMPNWMRKMYEMPLIKVGADTDDFDADMNMLSSDMEMTAGLGKSQAHKITGAAPKIFNLNVAKIVGIENMNTSNITEIPQKTQENLLKALTEALIDVQTAVK